MKQDIIKEEPKETKPESATKPPKETKPESATKPPKETEPESVAKPPTEAKDDKENIESKPAPIAADTKAEDTSPKEDDKKDEPTKAADATTK